MSFVGRKIGNYEVKALIGEGAMGAVYLGFQPIVRRKVAIKILKSDLARDQAHVHRFINEARAASAISHPNVVEISDVGTLEDGVPYLIMELLEGESLGAHLKRQGQLALTNALEIVLQATSALAAAHAQGIVHRDLKPDNIFLVSKTPGITQIKILDFGIAKIQGQVTDEGLRTVTGAVMGTAAYMSPEQCRGFVHLIDQRTDVYALGVILYQLLCGRPPFVSQGFGDLLYMHISQPPQPPRALNPQIPPFVELAILRALEKQREDRFPGMPHFAAALRNETDIPADIVPAISPSDTIPHPTVTESGHSTPPLAPTQILIPATTVTSIPKLGQPSVELSAPAALDGSISPATRDGIPAPQRQSRKPLAIGALTIAAGAAAALWLTRPQPRPIPAALPIVTATPAPVTAPPTPPVAAQPAAAPVAPTEPAINPAPEPPPKPAIPRRISRHKAKAAAKETPTATPETAPTPAPPPPVAEPPKHQFRKL